MNLLDDVIESVNAGKPGALKDLFAAAYAELHKLAHSRLHEGGRDTMIGTTALVHETYFRIMRGARLRPENRRAFFGYASQVMRSVIVDAVRQRRARRFGDGLERVTLSTDLADSLGRDEEAMLRVNEALDTLAAADPRAAKVVEMRYFGGFDEQEVGEALGVTARTVRRDWNKARLLLKVLLA